MSRRPTAATLANEAERAVALSSPEGRRMSKEGAEKAQTARRARSDVRKAAGDMIRQLAAGEEVVPERLAELSLADLANIAFALGVDSSVKERVSAHLIVQERLLGKATQRTESESTQRFVFEGPEWWFNREKPDELAAAGPRELPPAA